MGSDRRIDAFFTRAPKPSNNGGGGEAVKENKRSAAENESGAVEGGPKKAAAAEVWSVFLCCVARARSSACVECAVRCANWCVC